MIKLGLVFLVLLSFISQAQSALSPHTAYYKVRMISRDTALPIKDVSGVMYMKLGNTCDGWTITQKSSSRADVMPGNGGEKSQDLDSIYNVWESTDGRNLNFNSRRIQNKEFLLDVSGDSETKKHRTSIKFKSPEPSSMESNSGVLFPIKHLEKQLQAIKDGKTEISTTVFDGSSYGEPVKIKTTIRPGIIKCQYVDHDNKTHNIDTHLLKMEVSGANADTFTIQQKMSQTGVMCEYEIDFPTYSINGKLAQVSYDNKNRCS